MEHTTELIPPPPPSLKPSIADGDWTCNDCGNINFARRNQCNRCHKSRPNLPITSATNTAKKRKLGHEIGKAAAEKSRGLFSADDWQCNKCGNVNWARRQQCNVCNAPKFGEVEERTGFGGGYNDRGVVEYKERAESDDEYDEFGRRKKRRSSSTTTTTIIKEPNDKKIEKNNSNHKVDDKKDDSGDEKRRNDDEEEEVEEDDDDDEDGDLSKYDLSDWGDSSESNHKISNISRSKSRSRSRSPYSRK